MKLLIATQAVDERDQALGFFVRWIEEFSKHAETVEVIALKVGEYTLPANVRVHSLGKERGRPTLGALAYAVRFKWLAWRLRRRYDTVFVHMNPEYVVLGGWLWKSLRKPIALWYTHRNADMKLWLAEKFANVIFTASPESFRVWSKKVRYMRQAVNVEQFARPASRPREAGGPLRLVSVGRLTPIKNLDIIIAAVALLRNRGVACALELVGAPATGSDHAYAERLRATVAELKLECAVTFAGSVPYKDIMARYWVADASVNACPTGGMDKAVLESFAAETPVFLTNEAFKPLLAGYEDIFRFPERDAEALAKRLAEYAARADRVAIAHELAERVRREYSLAALIGSIAGVLSHL